MGQPLTHQLRVRYAECDQQGIVFNAHYLTYFDVNIAELFRAAFGAYGEVTARGIDVVVVEARVGFSAPAKFDELLELDVGVARLGSTSMSTAHRILCGGEVLAQGELHHVFVELPGLDKTPIPEWIRGGLEPYSLS